MRRHIKSGGHTPRLMLPADKSATSTISSHSFLGTSFLHNPRSLPHPSGPHVHFLALYSAASSSQIHAHPTRYRRSSNSSSSRSITMHAIASLSILALAGSVLAAPVANVNVVYVTDVTTVVVTAEATQAAATVYETQTQQQPHTWTRHHHYSHPAVATTVYQEAPPQETTTPPPQTTEQPQPTTEQPQPTSTQAPASGYMGTVNEWRGKLGLPTLAQDATLEANALKTCSDHPGQMVHELNSGSNAQVLAPGGPDDFVKVFVGGWLCEKPNMAGMNGICDTMSQGWSYEGQTGHADILSSTSYTKIGCANYSGIWACDLTF